MCGTTLPSAPVSSLNSRHGPKRNFLKRNGCTEQSGCTHLQEEKETQPNSKKATLYGNLKPYATNDAEWCLLYARNHDSYIPLNGLCLVKLLLIGEHT